MTSDPNHAVSPQDASNQSPQSIFNPRSSRVSSAAFAFRVSQLSLERKIESCLIWLYLVCLYRLHLGLSGSSACSFSFDFDVCFWVIWRYKGTHSMGCRSLSRTLTGKQSGQASSYSAISVCWWLRPLAATEVAALSCHRRTCPCSISSETWCSQVTHSVFELSRQKSSRATLSESSYRVWWLVSRLDPPHFYWP